MAYTPLRISIPKPCQEDWTKMTPVDGTTARHCDSCTKNVVDFTGFSDARMHAYVKEHGANTCGRFRPDQLDRPLRAHQRPSYTPLKIAATAAGLLAGVADAQAQVEAPWVGEIAIDQPIGLQPPAVGTDTLALDTVHVTGSKSIKGRIACPAPVQNTPILPINTDTSFTHDFPESEGALMGAVAYVVPKPTIPTRIWRGIKNVFQITKDTLGVNTLPVVEVVDATPRPGRPHKWTPRVNRPDLFTISPNPAVDEATIHYRAEIEEEINVAIYDGTGKRLRYEQWRIYPGENTLALPPRGAVTTKTLYVRLTDSQGHYTTKSLLITR